MRKAITGLVLALVLLLGGAIYAWGQGAFWPCEPAGRLIHGGVCTHLITGDIGGVAPLPNGNLLVSLGAPEGDDSNAITLAEIPATGGAVISETVLRANPVETHPLDLAVSPDGEQVAVVQAFSEGRTQYKVSAFDRQGAVLAEDLGWLPGYMAFDAGNRLLFHPGALLGEAVNPGYAEVYDLAVSPVPQVANWDELGALFQKGTTLAYSPDGTVFAQVLDHMESTSLVGLRVGTVGFEAQPGILLGASIRAGCNYSFSDLAFSPDGKRIAAVFDCPDDWGQVSSTMEVWDWSERQHLLTLPVVNGFSEPFWYDDNAIIAKRYNYVRGGTELFRIAVR
ncbi:MAG: hypothetical protein P0Y65_12465 [Candidatus Devosia phytovorans]|uniref:WD40 repeat domain-containing protein n=1 Tax=Candidatus Devosia phytovorans TaxID=3121372 RepID=A0AAJ5VT35_9HYPH|nr:hypothetical protein [Devosia sp.]WEK03018.1 MAG: hypothetical protein P0Y65_12465 [Devosia sp.]